MPSEIAGESFDKNFIDAINGNVDLMDYNFCLLKKQYNIF